MTNYIIISPPKEIPYGYCQCGCGQKTKIAKQNYREYGIIKGTPMHYINGHGGRNHKLSWEQRFWNHIDRRGSDECWLWIKSKSRYGYGRIGKGNVLFLAHRVAYQLCIGPIPDNLFICHRCSNPACCNPAHLYAGTPKDNHIDSVLAGTAKSPPHLLGEKNPNSKFTEQQIIEIRRLYASEFSVPYIAKLYRVRRSTIRRIVRRLAWKHIP